MNQLNELGLASLALLKRHPRRTAAVIAALLLVGTGGAMAVASFAPDAADLPVREVLESVDPLPLEAQSASGDLHSLHLYRTDITRSSDTAEGLLRRLGVEDPVAAAFLRADATVRQSLLGRAGRNVTAEAGDDNSLLKLQARWAAEDGVNFKRLVVEKAQRGWTARIETAPLVASSRLGSGTIRTSLFAATDESRIPDNVATQLAEIFSGDIDFHRALRKGDRFSVVYEALEADGEPLRAGKLLSAEFVNNGKSYQAMWFQSPGIDPTTGVAAKGGYYTLDGQSLRRAYLASPMQFSRVTSGFKMRFHPILLKWQAHHGVDYAAPTGTAVRSVGDGVVEFAGVQNGYGNVIMIHHSKQDSTVYAHLSRIDVKRGQTVSQGQNIGAVGATGWATGPHLHFEFRINGIYHDPMTIARQSEAAPVSAQARPLFERSARSVRQQLAAAATLQQANAQ